MTDFFEIPKSLNLIAIFSKALLFQRILPSEWSHSRLPILLLLLDED